MKPIRRRLTVVKAGGNASPAGPAGAGGGGVSPSLSIVHKCPAPSSADGGGSLVKEGPSSGAIRSAEAVRMQVELWARRYPDRLGFLTLTYLPHARTCSRQTMQRLWRKFMKARARTFDTVFDAGVFVWERHADGVIHWHAAVVCCRDIRTGSDVAVIRASGGRRGKNSALRQAWYTLRSWRRFGFGRNGLEPMLDQDAVAAYIAKYVTKDGGARLPVDAGAKRVRWVCKRGFRQVGCAFARSTARAESNRARLGAFCDWAGAADQDDFRRVFGPRWFWKFRHEVRQTPIAERLWSKGHGEAAMVAEREENRQAVRRYREGVAGAWSASFGDDGDAGGLRHWWRERRDGMLGRASEIYGRATREAEDAFFAGVISGGNVEFAPDAPVYARRVVRRVLAMCWEDACALGEGASAPAR